MRDVVSFGEWMAQRRKMLDMTQRELASRTNYALATIKKIEMDERRPSRDLAEALAGALQIPAEAQQKFFECARGLRPVDILAVVQVPLSDGKPVTAGRMTNDLPVNTTSTIGRTSELAQIARLLGADDCRLLTLVGTGGVGKTRLALEAARAQRDHFADGAVFVPLAAVTDTALIPNSIAHCLKLTLSGSAEEQLFAYLRDKNLLLLLDNCEQVVEGIGWLSDLLVNVPGVKLLATSRERLQLAEEWIYAVPMLEDAQAIDLFKQTARRLNPQFESGDISAVCRLVENLPLAIELAASWTPFLSCEQIAQNIQRDIDFLSANVRNIPERHRSIRAVFDYSWRLLSPAEKTVLMRLSVFRGGWTTDEAESIAGSSLLMLRALVEKSLVRVVSQGRYDLHELIRQYAADQLRNANQEAAIRQRHSEVFLKLAGELDSELYGPNGIAAFARLDEEQDNLRAGMSWALETGEIDKARQYVDKLFIYWQRRGHWVEGEHWAKAVDARKGEGGSPLLCWVLLHASVFIAMQGRFSEASLYKPRAMEMALRLEDPETMMRFLFVEAQATPDANAAIKIWEKFFATGTHLETLSKDNAAREALIAGGHFLYGDTLRDAGHYEAATAHYRQSLELYRQIGNVDLVAYPIGNLGRLALQDRKVNEAYQLFTESVALSRAIGNRVGVADWLQQLGNAALVIGDSLQAESCYEEALALYQEMANMPANADVLAELGYTSLVKGDVHQARQYLRESLSAFRTLGEMMAHLGVDWGILARSELCLCLRTAALVNVGERDFGRAVRLLSVAEIIQSKGGQGVDLRIQARVEDALNIIQTQLPEETFAREWATGRAMLLEQVWTTLADI